MVEALTLWIIIGIIGILAIDIYLAISKKKG